MITIIIQISQYRQIIVKIYLLGRVRWIKQQRKIFQIFQIIWTKIIKILAEVIKDKTRIKKWKKVFN